jgi:hypothetical protein
VMPLLVAAFAIVFGVIRRRRAAGAQNMTAAGALEKTAAKGA